MQGTKPVSESDQHVKKDVALEALRGAAAFVVVVWHFLLGFAPGHVPILGGDQSFSILGKPWFGLFYGTASVTFFFVLSGFVLSRKALLRSDTLILARGAVKRWPRLAAPVLFAVMVSWLLFTAHAYRFIEAGSVTGSNWLSTFSLTIPAGTIFTPSLRHAVSEGWFSTFFLGKANYDDSLWTMRIEFIGSFVVFGLAALLIALRDVRPVVQIWLVIIVLLICNYSSPFMPCFVIGVGLAALLNKRTPQIPLWLGCVLALLAFWLVGYFPGKGWYGWLTAHLHFAPPDPYIHAAGSVIAIFVIEATPALRRTLSGRLSVILGKLSFPVYLLHIPIMCSAGAAVFLATRQTLPGIEPKLAAAATTIVCTLLLAWPLALFDSWWVKKIGAATDRLVPRTDKSAAAETSYTIH